jgi:hypothetical protein
MSKPKPRGLAATFHVVLISGVRLSPLGTAATTGLFYKSQMIDDGDCGAIWWNED